MGESAYQKEMIRRLEDGGALVLNLHGHLFQKRGWPDLFVSSPHFSGWIELKSPGKEPTPLQRRILHRLTERQTPALWMRPTGFGSEEVFGCRKRRDLKICDLGPVEGITLIHKLREAWNELLQVLS